MVKIPLQTQKVSSTSASTTSKLDLRAPLFTRVSRGTGLERLRILTLVLIDSISISLAWLVAEAYGTPVASPWSLQQNPFALLIILATAIGLIAAQGLYQAGGKRRDYFSLIKTLTFAHFLLVLIAFLSEPSYFVSRSTFILAWLLSTSFTCAERLSVDIVLSRLRQRGAGRSPTFLICRPEETESAIRLIERENCFKVVGATDIYASDKQSWEVILENVRSLGVTQVFVCSWDSRKSRMFLYWSFRSAGIRLHILPIGLEAFLEAFCQKAEFGIVGGIPSITFYPPLITGSDFYIKRCFDFAFSGLFLLLAAPLYLGIALLIKLDSSGPIFYKQTRIGLHGQPFKAWKFRTMVANADRLQKELETRNEIKDGVLFKIKDDPRVTRVGKFLRRYSLDELPQVFNVLFGEMSLVGPRPLPTRDVEKFSEHHFIRQEVLPGITGLWQVSGRSDIPDFEEVLRLDVTYIENWSLWLDIKILLQTAKVVVLKQGAY